MSVKTTIEYQSEVLFGMVLDYGALRWLKAVVSLCGFCRIGIVSLPAYATAQGCTVPCTTWDRYYFSKSTYKSAWMSLDGFNVNFIISRETNSDVISTPRKHSAVSHVHGCIPQQTLANASNSTASTVYIALCRELSTAFYTRVGKTDANCARTSDLVL
jgi:hypothetical protein